MVGFFYYYLISFKIDHRDLLLLAVQLIKERERERERCHMIKIADHVTGTGLTTNEKVSWSSLLLRYYSCITF